MARHTLRLVSALAGLKLITWPFAGPAVIREGDEAHLIDSWRYLGTARSDEEISELLASGRAQFDRDTYRILAKYTNRMTPLLRVT
jgi:DNA polymerase-3 subunit epsilon